MKIALWVLILAVTTWTIQGDRWIPQALGAATWTSVETNVTTSVTVMTAANGMVVTATQYYTATNTRTNTSTGGPSTNTQIGANNAANCHSGGAQYGGGQWNYCNRTDDSQQQNSEADTKDLNDNGAQQSTNLGMAAIAAGMAMVAAGVALLPNPPTTPAGVALIAAGMALIASGMAALAAAKKMNQSAITAGKYENKLSKLESCADNDKLCKQAQLGQSKSDLGAGDTGIKIDSALMREGKMDGIYSDMEAKTGIDRETFANSMANGGDPLDLLANSLKGKPGGSEDNLRKMMADTMEKGDLPSGQEVMDKLGLNEIDLGKAGKRDLASSSPNIDALFPGQGATTQPSDPNAGKVGAMKISSEIQAALDKNGITDRTIFQMVHGQYKKKTPLMFGVPADTGRNPSAANPFEGLGGEKVEL